LSICRNQTAQHSKTGKYSYKRGIIVLHFGEKYASLPLPIFENHGRRIVGTEWTTLAMEYHALSLWYIFVDSDIEQRSWIAFGIDILD